MNVKVIPINQILVFKEHHAKYCRCEKGRLLTGKAETECWDWSGGMFKLLEEGDGRKILKCSKSGFKIVLLKSTDEELNSSDELGSTFLRWHM